MFYRVLLQTRLERVLGRWNVIAAGALLFGLFHLPARLVFVWLGTTGSVGWGSVQALAGVKTSEALLNAGRNANYIRIGRRRVAAFRLTGLG